MKSSNLVSDVLLAVFNTVVYASIVVLFGTGVSSSNYLYVVFSLIVFTMPVLVSAINGVTKEVLDGPGVVVLNGLSIMAGVLVIVASFTLIAYLSQNVILQEEMSTLILPAVAALASLLLLRGYYVCVVEFRKRYRLSKILARESGFEVLSDSL